MLNVNQGGNKYHFWVFGMTWPVIEHRFPGPLANTLPIKQELPLITIEGWYAIKLNNLI